MWHRQATRAVAAFLGAAAVVSQARAAGPCQVMVMSRPAGAVVHVDGKERGKTPVMLPGLKLGYHEVKIVLDDHRTWAKRIRLRPGGNTVDAKLVKKGAPAPATSKDRDKSGAASPKARAATADGGKGAKAGKDAKDEVPKTRKVPCPCCEGKGIVVEIGCQTCQADGYVGTTACGMCRSTGRVAYSCPFCRGGGTIVGGKATDCRGCKGKGAPLCPPCKGTGKIDRRNPEAASYKTTVCLSCGGDGCERQFKCKTCAGKGTVKRRSSDAVYVYTREITCPHCKGEGSGPPKCTNCGGDGYLGSSQACSPCMTCCGTGRIFTPCRTCRGNGWHRAR